VQVSKRAPFIAGGITLVAVGLVILIAWAAKHDADKLADQQRALELLGRAQWFTAAFKWQDYGQEGETIMDYVPQYLRDNPVACEAIRNGKFVDIQEAMR
jgi:hypothetical protein